MCILGLSRPEIGHLSRKNVYFRLIKAQNKPFISGFWLYVDIQSAGARVRGGFYLGKMCILGLSRPEIGHLSRKNVYFRVIKAKNRLLILVFWLGVDIQSAGCGACGGFYLGKMCILGLSRPEIGHLFRKHVYFRLIKAKNRPLISGFWLYLDVRSAGRRFTPEKCVFSGYQGQK